MSSLKSISEIFKEVYGEAILRELGATEGDLLWVRLSEMIPSWKDYGKKIGSLKA